MCFLHPPYHPKIIGDIVKDIVIDIVKSVQKASACLIEVIQSMTMKIMLGMKNRSPRYGINRPRPRHGHKFAKFKICLSRMMVICIKQQLTRQVRKVQRPSPNCAILVKTCWTIIGPE